MPEDKNKKGNSSFFDSPVIPVLIVILAFLMRLPAIFLKSLYVDEGVTLYISQKPLPQIVPFMVQLHEVHPPLYFWFVNIWNSIPVIPIKNLAWLRLSSVLFGVLTVYFTYLLGLKLFNRKVALLAAFFTAISSFHIYYCQELRMYPMILFFMLASFYFFLGLLTNPNWKTAGGYIVSSGLALVTHYYAFYIFAIEFLFFLLMGFLVWKKKSSSIRETEPGCKDMSSVGGDRLRAAIDLLSGNPGIITKRWTWIVIPVILSWLFFLPWVPYFINQTGAQDFTLRMTPGAGDFFEIFSRIAYGFNLVHPYIGKVDLFVIASILPIFLIIFSVFKVKGMGKWFTLIYLLFPVVLTFLVTLVSRFHIFEFKYFFIIVPAFWLLISSVICEFKLKWVKWGILAIFIITNIWTNVNAQLISYYQPQDWEAATKIVKENQRPGDLVGVHPSMMSISMFYYYGNITNFLPMDYPKDERMKLLKNYKGLWLVSTPHHPFVRQAGLLKYLRENYPHKLVKIIDRYRPSDVILIEYFDLSHKHLEE